MGCEFLEEIKYGYNVGIVSFVKYFFSLSLLQTEREFYV